MKLTRDLIKDFFGDGSKYVVSLILLGALASGATQNGANNKSLRFTKKRLSGNCRKCPKMLRSWSAVEVVAG